MKNVAVMMMSRTGIVPRRRRAMKRTMAAAGTLRTGADGCQLFFGGWVSLGEVVRSHLSRFSFFFLLSLVCPRSGGGVENEKDKEEGRKMGVAAFGVGVCPRAMSLSWAGMPTILFYPWIRTSPARLGRV